MSEKKKRSKMLDDPEKKRPPEEEAPDPVTSAAEEEQETFPPAPDEKGGGDALDDLRQSLKEEEHEKQERKQRSFIGRVTSRLTKPKKTNPLSETVLAERIQPQEPPAQEVQEEPAPQEEASAPDPSPVIDEAAVEAEAAALIAELDAELEALKSETPETSESTNAIEPVLEAPPLPSGEPEPAPVQPPPGMEALRKKPADGAEDKSVESMREVALEGYGSDPVKPDTPKPTLQKRAGMLLRSLRPFDRFLIFGALILICLAGVGGVGLRVLTSRLEEAPPAPTTDRPVPVGVTLPGGWEFDLGRGQVVDGRWSPQGAEWLEGTELCRWVALPWSVQLEAVVRTLKSNDTVELRMSNADVLTYKVYSIESVPVDQIEAMETKKPCLLVILADARSDMRWVVTAYP